MPSPNRLNPIPGWDKCNRSSRESRLEDSESDRTSCESIPGWNECEQTVARNPTWRTAHVIADGGDLVFRAMNATPASHSCDRATSGHGASERAFRSDGVISFHHPRSWYAP